jgi:hypothetical protein
VPIALKSGSLKLLETSGSLQAYNGIALPFFEVFASAICRGADKSLARPTSRCILFDGENISFDVALVIYIYIYIYINSNNINTIMFINMIYEHKNLLSL